MNDKLIESQIQLAGQDFKSQLAEESVIASIISDNGKADIVTAKLKPEDFSDSTCKAVFEAVEKIRAKRGKVDIVTVDSELFSIYPLQEREITKRLFEIMHSIDYSSASEVESYVEVVRQLSQRRKTISTLDTIARLLRDPQQDYGEVLEQIRDAGNGTNTEHRWESLSEVMTATYSFLEERSIGKQKSITTGIKCVNDLIGGFFDGELTIVGARPSVGKSAFGANIAIQAAREGFKVAFVSREMQDIQFGQRVISYGSNIDGMKLRKCELDGDDWIAISEAIPELSDLPIDFVFSIRTIEDLRNEVKRKKSNGEIDILIVDYLQLMDTKKKFREENLRVGYISRMLKDIATDCKIPVIALAQVNRDADGAMPTLKNLKASGDIEQDADGIIFLHRPNSENDPYIDPRDREFFQQYKDSAYTYLVISVAKQRQGSIGQAAVLFDAAKMRYLQIERGREE